MFKLLFFVLILTTSQSVLAECDQTCAETVLEKNGLKESAFKNRWNVFKLPVPLAKNELIFSGPILGKNAFVLEASWLFYVDIYPGRLFAHKTFVILVSKSSAEITTFTFDGYPIVRSVAYFSSDIDLEVKDYWPEGYPRFYSSEYEKELIPLPPTDMGSWVPGDADIPFEKHPLGENEDAREHQRDVRGYYEKQQGPKSLAQEFNACPCSPASKNSYALIINGHSHPGEKHIGKESIEFLKKNFKEVNHLSSYHPDAGLSTNAMTSRKNISEAFDQLKAKIQSCCDEVTIVIQGHGSSDGKTAMNVPTTYPEIVGGKPTGNMLSHGSRDGFYMTTDFLRNELNKIKSCKVKVLIFSCFSGSHLDKGLNAITPKEMNQGCMCRSVFTTSSSRQISGTTDSQELFDLITKSGGDYLKGILEFQKRKEKFARDFGVTSNQTPQVQSTDCVLCKDHDGDGVLSGEELKDGASDPEKADTDGDGLNDAEEKIWKTNPREKDSDNDTLSDGKEVKELKTNPNSKDSDGDGLIDPHEIFAGTDPNNPDTDGDGQNDKMELNCGSNPLDPKSKCE